MNSRITPLIVGGVMLIASQTAFAVPCGNVTAEGQCTGTVLSFCDQSMMLQQFDCGGLGAACEQVSSTWGFDCVVGIGSSCISDQGEWAVFCRGPNNGCVGSIDGAVCTSNVGACTVADVDTCRGTSVVLGCKDDEPILLDCRSYGATGCQGGICVNAVQGSPCDSLITCAAGLVCEATTQLCTPGSSPADAGTAPRDSGTTAPRDAGMPRDGGTASTSDAGTSSRDAGTSNTTINANVSNDAGVATQPQQFIEVDAEPNSGCQATGYADPLLFILYVFILAMLTSSRMRRRHHPRRCPSASGWDGPGSCPPR